VTNKTSPPNESTLIDVIISWLQSCGITVKLHDFDLHYGGQYIHETHTIRINDPETRSALMTLAHEAGHAIGYVMHRNNAARPQLFRERQAYA